MSANLTLCKWYCNYSGLLVHCCNRKLASSIVLLLFVSPCTFHQCKELLLASCTNCLTSSLLERKVVNTPFAFLYSFNMLCTKPCPPWHDFWSLLSAHCYMECHVTTHISLALRALPVELHKLLAWTQIGKHSICFLCGSTYETTLSG